MNVSSVWKKPNVGYLLKDAEDDETAAASAPAVKTTKASKSKAAAAAVRLYTEDFSQLRALQSQSLFYSDITIM